MTSSMTAVGKRVLRCVRCQGRVFRTEDGLECLNCGNAGTRQPTAEEIENTNRGGGRKKAAMPRHTFTISVCEHRQRLSSEDGKCPVCVRQGYEA